MNVSHLSFLSPVNQKFMAILIAVVAIHLIAPVSSVFLDHINADGSDRTGSDITAEKEPIPESLRSVVDCKLGRPHRKYQECRCGEYAVIVPRKEIPDDSLTEYHVRTVERRFNNIKHIYYFCSYCSLCPDGVRTKTNCSRLEDTQCSDNVCVNSNHVFDKGRKACISPNNAQTSEATTSTNQSPAQLGSAHSETRSQDLKKDVAATPGLRNAISESLLRDKPVLIVGVTLIIAVLFVLVINVRIYVYFRNHREGEEERERMITSQKADV